ARQAWRVIVGVEPGEREDLTDLELLLTGGQAVSIKVERNAPCPCLPGRRALDDRVRPGRGMRPVEGGFSPEELASFEAVEGALDFELSYYSD
ncbi:MAG: hypothetical protein ACK46X_19035, partial [Candidatus Sericytochromatia bacterium]